MNKEKIIDFGVLALRWYLVFYMISYGWAKLTMSQFGVFDPEIIAQPMEDIDNFYVAWHLFGRSTFFNISSGIIEIVGGLLLIPNRTAIIGSLIVLSILAQILIIDISFTTSVHGLALPFRIGGMIIADLMILYYYKDRLAQALKSITQNVTTKLKYKWWVYLILPVVGLLMDFVFAIGLFPLRMVADWIYN